MRGLPTQRTLIGLTAIVLVSVILFWLGNLTSIGLHGDEAWFGLRAAEYLHEGIRHPWGMNHYSGILQGLVNAFVFKYFGIGIFQLRISGVVINSISLVLLLYFFYKKTGAKSAFFFALFFAQSAFYLISPKIAWEVCTFNLLFLTAFVISLYKLSNDKNGNSFSWAFVFLFSSLLGSYNHILFSSLPLSFLAGLGLWKYYNGDHVGGTKSIAFLLITLINSALLFLFTQFALAFLWPFYHFYCFAPFIALIVLESFFFKALVQWCSAKLEPVFKIRLSKAFLICMVFIFILSFALFHGIILFQTLSQRILFLRVFSYEFPSWMAVICLATAGVISSYFIMSLVNDIRLLPREPWSFIIIGYSGIFTLYTTEASIRYFLIMFVLMCLYLGFKLSSRDGPVRVVVAAALVTNILLVQSMLWFLSSNHHRKLRAIDFAMGNGRTESSAHFLPFGSVLDFINTHKVGQIETTKSEEAETGHTYDFYKLLNPQWEKYPNRARITYDKISMGDGFRKEPLPPQTTEKVVKTRTDKIQAAIQDRLESGEFPGIQYYVTSPDSTIFSQSAGLADVQSGKPITPSTTMAINGMYGVFISVAALQMVDEGKLALDDPVSEYVSSVSYGDRPTVRNLLSQTSGIPNSTRYHKLSFEPGKKYAYSRLAYRLLEEAITAVSAMSSREYLQKNIFQKLNLTVHDAQFIDTSDYFRATGYLSDASVSKLFKSCFMDAKRFDEYEDSRMSDRHFDFLNFVSLCRTSSSLAVGKTGNIFGFGRKDNSPSWIAVHNDYCNEPLSDNLALSSKSLCVFLRDMLRDHPVLFSSKTKALLFDQQKTNSGQLIDMSLGWHVGLYGNAKYFYKEGGGGGFHCEMRMYPVRKIASVAMANSALFDAHGFLDDNDWEFFN